VSERPDISVCIATFRRPDGLARLLTSLARTKLPEGVSSEVIVVDNDAAGDARSRALEACAAAAEARWLVEPEQNIARARNRALSEARGTWIAFIDDDEVAEEGWLAAYWSEAARDAADGFFGPVRPILAAPEKRWLDLATFFGRPEHATGTPVRVADLSTSNALLRRSLFADRRFDPAWGRSGGSDLELFERLLASGARFVWCADARVSETIPPHRYRLRWLSQRAFRGGVGFTRLELDRGRGEGMALRAAVALVALAVLLPLSLLGGRRLAARTWLRTCTQAGHLWAHAGRSYEEYRPTPPGVPHE